MKTESYWQTTARSPQFPKLAKNLEADVVIIGGGAHGLACAYYLAKNHGITDVAILEQKYIGYGGSGRNTTIIRSNYLTPEGVRFYDQSVKLYQDMSAELDFNVMFSQRGHVTLVHPAMREVVAALWKQDVIPDYRDPGGLRVGLSPLSTSYDEVDRGIAAVREVLA